MEIKTYIRKGVLGESMNYEELLTYDGSPPRYVIAVLEGKGRRKLNIAPKRTLFESYFLDSFIGLEDILLNKSVKGGAGVFPGSHYILWDSDDFLSCLQAYPNLTRIAIDSLSRRIRIYDARQKKASFEIRSQKLGISENGEEKSNISEDLKQSLYQMTFSDNNEFPQDVIDKLSVSYKEGDHVMRQGEKTNDIYIVLSGEVRITRSKEGSPDEELLDILGQGEFVGEMAMFDGLPRSANAIANKDLLVLKFDSANFHLIFHLQARWSMQILETLAQRIDQRREELSIIPMSEIYNI